MSCPESTAFFVAVAAVTGVLRPGEVYAGTALMLLVGCLLYGVYAAWQHLLIIPGVLPLVVAICASSLFSILSNREADAWRRPTGLLVCGAVCFLAGLQLGHRSRRRLLVVLGGVGILVIVHGAAQALGGFGELADTIRADPGLSVAERELYLARLALSRPFGPFSLPALLGVFTAFLTALFVSSAVDRNRGRPERAGCLVIGLLAISLVAATKSIGAIASLVLALSCAVALRRFRLRRLLLMTLCLGLLIVVVVRRHESHGRDPATLRFLNYRAALGMAYHHPSFGVGVGGFAFAYPRFRPVSANNTKHAHSFLMRGFAETGIPGGFVVLLLYAVVVSRLMRQLRTDIPLDRAYALGALVLVIHSLGDIDMDVESFALLTPALVGVALAPAAGKRFGSAPLRLLTTLVLLATLWFAASAGAGRLLVDRASAAARAGERGQALHLLQAATRYDRRSSTAWMLLGEEALQRGDLAAAAASLRIAARLSPERGRVRRDLAVTLARMGRPQEAWQAIKAAKRLLPGDREIERIEERLTGAQP